jgi:hypothetical protein
VPVASPPAALVEVCALTLLKKNKKEIVNSIVFLIFKNFKLIFDKNIATKENKIVKIESERILNIKIIVSEETSCILIIL